MGLAMIGFLVSWRKRAEAFLEILERWSVRNDFGYGVSETNCNYGDLTFEREY